MKSLFLSVYTVEDIIIWIARTKVIKKIPIALVKTMSQYRGTMNTRIHPLLNKRQVTSPTIEIILLQTKSKLMMEHGRWYPEKVIGKSLIIFPGIPSPPVPPLFIQPSSLRRPFMAWKIQSSSLHPIPPHTWILTYQGTRHDLVELIPVLLPDLYAGIMAYITVRVGEWYACYNTEGCR
ncbi:dicer-like protein [Corchorus olitorius]|uniref:Dicer-like protein n=1 Tax=Corchorus olitorius TaxID=93759 RepID=A0A1R3KPB0_9ROSI|nr:dicer-like protein [Corchorus olitorius]